jgi:hypothetical protein
MQLVDARDFDQPGLKIVSNYQYGKADTADWLGGPAAGLRPANRDWELHFAAGGSYGAAIYASIDDDPTCEQEKQLVAPYIRGWESVLGRHRVGRYANSKAIESALQDGLGSWFWQHNWGPPGRVAHPAAHRHQVEVDPRQVAGVGSTSITSTRPVSGGGTAEHYRPVRFASKLPVAAAAAGCVGPARAGPRVDAPRCR